MRRTRFAWRWWTVVLRGVAAVLFGLFAVFAPQVVFLSLVLLFGIYAIIDGALALSLGFQATAYPRGAMVVRGVISVAAGFVALFLPGITGFALLLVIGAWAVTSGILEIVMAVRMRKQLEHEWLLGIEGALSVVFGVLLFLSPLAGAIVLGLWVGAYALVIGGMLIGTGFRLRSYLRAHPQAAAAVAA